jgi:hypothetical protein
MNEPTPGTTFRGLPLTAEQESEIEHYIRARARCGAPWDTPELKAMIVDMLDPPEVTSDDEAALDESMATERGTASGEEPGDLDELNYDRDRNRT